MSANVASFVQLRMLDLFWLGRVYVVGGTCWSAREDIRISAGGPLARSFRRVVGLVTKYALASACDAPRGTTLYLR